jgi:hypothetical protein
MWQHVMGDSIAIDTVPFYVLESIEYCYVPGVQGRRYGLGCSVPNRCQSSL